MFNDPEFRRVFSKGIAELMHELILSPLKREIAELRSVESRHEDRIKELEARISGLEARAQVPTAKTLKLVSDG